MKTKKGILCGVMAGVLCLAGVFAWAPMVVAEEKEGASEATEKVEEASEPESDDVLQVETGMVDFGFAGELGRSYTSQFKVKNTSKDKIVVKFTTEEYGKNIAAESKIGKDWLSFVGGKNIYEIDAEAEADVAIRFNVPTDAEKGRSQYAIIRATVASEKGKDQTDEVVVKITTSDEKLEFGGKASNELTPLKLNDEVKGAAVVRNEGKVGFESKVSVRVSPAFGLENWEDVVAEQAVDVAPGDEVRVEFAKNIAYGFYKVEQKISYVNSEGKIITATNVGRVLLCPIWALIAIAVVIVAIIALVIVLKIRGKRKAEAE